MFTLEDVLQGSGGRLVAGARRGIFQRASIDSRSVRLGDLFIALRGENHDGHTFVPEALARGAAGALVETLPTGLPGPTGREDGPPIVLVASTSEALPRLASYWRRRHRVRVVGVTGSVGKTTAKEVTAQLLSQRFGVLGSSANLNTELGLSLSLMELDASHELAVLEMAMYELGEIDRLATIAQPEVGIVTNVLPTHLERLASLDRIAEAKGELVRALPPEGLALLNGDDPFGRAMAAWSRAPSLLYGTSSEADLWAEDVRPLQLKGLEATFHYQGQQARAHLKLLGAHSVYSALAAAGVGLHFGMGFHEVVEGLGRVQPGPRLRVLQGRNGATVIDDAYNASPASTLAALDLLQQMQGRRIAILGDMLELGSFEEQGHRMVGQRVAQVAHQLLTIGPRARTIATEAVACGMDRAWVHCFDHTEQAVPYLREDLGPDDYVLVKGSRAMQLEQIVQALGAAPTSA